MFNFSKKFSRRSKKSPYLSGVDKRDRGNDYGGSSVSLPTLYGHRSSKSQSSHLSKTMEPVSPSTLRNQVLNSRFDPDAPPGMFAQNGPTRRNRPLSRPRTFYRLFGFATDSDSDIARNDWLEESKLSPVALPHKALTLLGIEEASGFGTPTSPSPQPWNDLGDDYTDDEQEYYRKAIRSELPSLRLADPPPERLYFRPQSLCSSFSTSSGKTATTTVTSMTASPSVGYSEENGKFNLESTLKGMSMLNLDDSDEEEAPVIRRIAPELPIEIALQICELFVTEIHQGDLKQEERYRRCPNCNIYTLWALSMVSRLWNTVANRLLYGTVSLDFGQYTAPSRDQDGKGVAPKFIPYTTCCSKNGEPLHTKTDVDAKLQLLYRTIWDSQGDIGGLIRGIKLPRRLFSITKYPLSAILQKCPNLEFVDHAVTSGSTEDLVSILSKLRQMKRWTWKREQGIKYEQTKVRQRRMTVMVEMKKSMNGPPPEIALEVFPLWTKLQHLELNNLRRMEIPDQFDFCALPSLESVSLRNLCIVDRSHETRFLDRFPALRRLEIDASLFINSERIVSYLKVKGSKMTHLELYDSVIPIHMLYQILANTPSLVEFSVSNLPPTPPYSYNLLGTPAEISRTLPDLHSLRHVSMDMQPLRESFSFLLALVEQRGKAPRLAKMCMGFEAAERGPELGRSSKAMDGDEMRLEVRLRTECLFNGVQLLVS